MCSLAGYVHAEPNHVGSSVQLDDSHTSRSNPWWCSDGSNLVSRAVD